MKLNLIVHIVIWYIDKIKGLFYNHESIVIKKEEVKWRKKQ